MAFLTFDRSRFCRTTGSCFVQANIIKNHNNSYFIWPSRWLITYSVISVSHISQSQLSHVSIPQWFVIPHSVSPLALLSTHVNQSQLIPNNTQSPAHSVSQSAIPCLINPSHLTQSIGNSSCHSVNPSVNYSFTQSIPHSVHSSLSKLSMNQQVSYSVIRHSVNSSQLTH